MGFEKKKKKRSSNVNTAQPMDQDQWETEEDLRAVARAHAINKDHARMKKVKSLAKNKLEDSKKRRAEADHMIKLGQS
jgi:hypothetical protein